MSIISVLVLSGNECQRYFMFSEFSWRVEALRQGVLSQLSCCSSRQYNSDVTHCSRLPLGLAFIHIVEQSYSISEITKMNMASTVNRKIVAH